MPETLYRCQQFSGSLELDVQVFLVRTDQEPVWEACYAVMELDEQHSLPLRDLAAERLCVALKRCGRDRPSFG